MFWVFLQGLSDKKKEEKVAGQSSLTFDQIQNMNTRRHCSPNTLAPFGLISVDSFPPHAGIWPQATSEEREDVWEDIPFP